MPIGTCIVVANPIVLRGRFLRTHLALGRILRPCFVHMFLCSAVDLVEVLVGKDLSGVAAEDSGLVALSNLSTTAAVDLLRISYLTADGDSLGHTAENVFLR